MLAKRRLIQSRRVASTEDIAAWFSYKPVSKPAPKQPVFELQTRAKIANS